MRNSQNWFSKHSDWFSEHLVELIQVIIIGLVGIFISFQANNISKSQLKLNQAQCMPQFNINERQERNEEGIVNQHTIEVSCDNGFFTNYSSNVICILNIAVSQGDTIHIPLIGYWVGYGKTGNTTGVIERIMGYHNFEKIHELSDRIEKISENFLYIETETYLNIRYVDILSKEQNKYYEVQPIYATQTIDEETYKGKLKYHDDTYKSNLFLDLDSYTDEDLKRILNL